MYLHVFFFSGSVCLKKRKYCKYSTFVWTMMHTRGHTPDSRLHIVNVGIHSFTATVIILMLHSIAAINVDCSSVALVQ